MKKKKIEPSIYKSKVYRGLMKEFGKPPKVKITAIEQTPEEKKKAKIMQDLINYQFETNYNGLATKYFELMKKVQEEYSRSILYGVKIRWDVLKKYIKYATDSIEPE